MKTVASRRRQQHIQGVYMHSVSWLFVTVTLCPPYFSAAEPEGMFSEEEEVPGLGSVLLKD